MNKLRGLKTLSLRISNPFGERQYARGAQGFVAAAMEHAFAGRALPVWGDGSTIRDFIYVGDVARAIVAACGYSGDATEINIGAGEGRSLVEVAHAVEAASQRPLALAYQPGRSIDVAANVLDITRARQELGWEPRVEFDQALSRTAQWWRSL
jgi:UDP-glucose 4-epimerase